MKTAVIMRAYCLLQVAVAALCLLGCSAPEPDFAEESSISTATAAVTVETRQLRIELPSTKANPAEFVLGATGELKINDRASVNAPVSNMGSGTTNFGVESKGQNVWSVPSVALRNYAAISGTVVTTGQVNTQAGAAVQGGIMPGTNISPSYGVHWNVEFPDTNQGYIDVHPDGSQTLAPGAYAGVSAKSRAHLYLSTGTYLMDQLFTEPQSVLHLDTSAGPIYIYVRNYFFHRGEMVTDAGPRSQVLVGVLGMDNVHIEAPFIGTLVVPYAKVTLENVGGHIGAVFAKDIELHQGGSITHEPFPWELILPFNVAPVTPNPYQQANYPESGYTNFGALTGLAEDGREYILDPLTGQIPSVSGLLTCTGSYADNLKMSFVHEVNELGADASGKSCSSCGGCSSGGVSAPEIGRLQSLQISRIHRPAFRSVHASFGGGVFSNFDLQLRLEPGAVPEENVIALFDPKQDIERIAFFELSETDGDAVVDGLYHDANGQSAKSLELLDASGELTSDMSAAVSARLTKQTGTVLTFDIVDVPDETPEVRFGRYTGLADRNGNAMTVSYAYARDAGAGDPSFDGDLLWQIDTVTDMYGVSASFAYGADKVNDAFAVSEIQSPTGGTIRYSYDTAKPGGGLVGPALSRVDYPDGSASTFDTAVDPETQLLVVSFDDKAAASGSVRKDVYLTLSEYVDESGETVSQPEGRVRQIINGDGEVVYANWQDPEDDTVMYVYEGGGALIRVTSQNGDVPDLYAKAVSYDPATQEPWEVAFEDVESYEYGTGNMLVRTVDKFGNVQVIERDPATRAVTGKTYADGTGETYELNDFGQPVRITDREGNVTEYTYDDNGNLTSETHAVGTDNEMTRTATYNDRGQPLSKTDGNGHTTNYVYDTEGRLIQVIEPADRDGDTRPVTTYEYDSAGRVFATTDQSGRRRTFHYDLLGRVDEIGYPGGSSETFSYDGKLLIGHTDRNGTLKTLVYDDTSRLSEEILGDGTAEAVVNTKSYVPGSKMVASETKAGERTDYVYDARRRLSEKTVYPQQGVALTESTVYDSMGRRYSTTDAYGRTKYFVYDADSRVTRTVQELVPGAVSADADLLAMERDLGPNPNYVIEDRFFNARGMISDELDYRGVLSSMSYDELGRLVEKREAVGLPEEKVTRYDHDAEGNVVQILNPRHFAEDGDFVTEKTYTGRNLLATETHAVGTTAEVTASYQYSPTGKRSVTVDTMGQTRTAIFDACCDRIVAKQDALGGTTQYTYDNNGNLLVETDPLGNETRYTYDVHGRKLTVTNAENETTTYVYDDDMTDGAGLDALYAAYLTGLSFGGDVDGSAVLSTDAMGDVTFQVLDGLGRAVLGVDGNGNATFKQYDELVDGLVETAVTDALGRTNRVRVDGNDRERESEDALGNVLYKSFDANGNELSYRDPSGVGVDCVYDAFGRAASCTDTAGNSTSRQYDAADNTIVSTDGTGNLETCEFDAMNRSVRCTSGLGAVREMQYDAASHIVARVDAEGNVTTYAYNAKGETTSVTYPDGRTVTLSYDAAGQKTGITNQNGDTSRIIYDAAGRVVERRYPDGTRDLLAYDDASRMTYAYSEKYDTTVTRDYDIGGRTTRETQTVAGTARELLYGWNAVNERISITYPDGTEIEREWDPRGLLSLVSADDDVLAEMTYDNAARLLSTTLANGLTENLSYTAGGLTADQKWNGVTEFEYTYDADDRMTAMADLAQAQQSQTFGYDAEGRLTEWTKADGGSQSWTLSPEGDWQETVKDGTAESRTHSAVHETVTVGDNSLSYDLRGNLILDDEGDAFTWDARGQLEQATMEDGTVVMFSYDALGRRLAKTVDGETTAFVRDGDELIAEYTPSGGVRKYVSGLGTDKPVAMISNDDTYFYTRNLVGTVAAVTDDAGQVVERYGYNSHGARQIFQADGTPIDASTVGNSFGFTGRYHDDETDLIYFRTRYFDSRLGVFISRDVEYVDGLSLYKAYFIPNSRDPLGMGLWKKFKKSVKKAVNTVKDFGSDVVDTVTHPVDTLTTVANTGIGIVRDPVGALKSGVSFITNDVLPTLYSLATITVAPVAEVRGNLTVNVGLCEGRVTVGGSISGKIGFRYAGGLAGETWLFNDSTSGQFVNFGIPSLGCRPCGTCCYPNIDFDIQPIVSSVNSALKPITSVWPGLDCAVGGTASSCMVTVGAGCSLDLRPYIPVIGQMAIAIDALPGATLKAWVSIAGQTSFCNDASGFHFGPSSITGTADIIGGIGI